MAQSLAWRVLSPEQTHECLSAPDVPSIRAVLKQMDDSSSGDLLRASNHNEGQVLILLDMLSHLILFAKSRQMTPEKVSTLVGIVLRLHEESMEKPLTRAQSYQRLREFILQHSVPRPPFSCGIFTLCDVQDIDEYLLETYYRHYKMYVYAFVPQEVANLRCVHVDHIHETPPLGLPPLSTAIEEGEWRAKVEEMQREAEAARMVAAEEASEAAELERQRVRTLNDPRYSDGIKEQLACIKKEVSGKAIDRLDEIEARLTEIEKKVAEGSPRAESRQKKR